VAVRRADDILDNWFLCDSQEEPNRDRC